MATNSLQRVGRTILADAAFGQHGGFRCLPRSRSLLRPALGAGLTQRTATATRPFSASAVQSNASSKPLLAIDSYKTTNVLDLMSLRGRVVVITGGAKGIGMALAFAVVEAGGKVAIVDAADRPDEAYSDLQRLGGETKFYQSDVTDYDRLQGTFATIVTDFQRIDGLITAAGICPDESFLERDPRSVKRCMEINNLGTYYAAQLAARQMVSQSRLQDSSSAGSIVPIASMAAHRACRGQYTSDYSMTKGAVLALTRQLGVELAHHDIRVNCISPGYIETDLIGELVQQRPALGRVFQEDPAMKRMGNRTDLKAAAVFLLSNASAYMTSGEMLITGGCHAGAVY